MSKHKSHIEDKKCMCSKCPLRFVCFTEERIFSDPIFQGLFEALMAKGLTKEEAVDLVANEIKLRIKMPTVTSESPSIPYPIPNPTPWTITTDIYPSSNIPWTYTYNDRCINITYTMMNGDEVSWNANADKFDTTG
jgi:hypothetical protein